METFVTLRIAKYFGISFNDFIGQPRECVEGMIKIATKAIELEAAPIIPPEE